MICEKCGGKMTSNGYTETEVAYYSPEGHNHDDNCQVSVYRCQCGHYSVVSKRRRCPICDWAGKKTCFCHTGEKVDEWPD